MILSNHYGIPIQDSIRSLLLLLGYFPFRYCDRVELELLCEHFPTLEKIVRKK